MIEAETLAVYSGKDEPVTRDAQSTDASRLTFPVQMVIAAIIMTISIIGSVYGMTSGIRESQLQTESDLRDMRTRMEMQTQIDIARNDARTQEVQAQNEAILELKRLTQMLQIQYSELSKQIQLRR